METDVRAYASNVFRTVTALGGMQGDDLGFCQNHLYHLYRPSVLQWVGGPPEGVHFSWPGEASLPGGGRRRALLGAGMMAPPGGCFSGTHREPLADGGDASEICWWESLDLLGNFLRGSILHHTAQPDPATHCSIPQPIARTSLEFGPPFRRCAWAVRFRHLTVDRLPSQPPRSVFCEPPSQKKTLPDPRWVPNRRRVHNSAQVSG